MKRLFICILTLFSVSVFAQQQSPFPRFGKISAADLRQKMYSIDSGANAVVLSDICEISVEGNNKGWFSVVTNRHRVVHILNKSGYDLANVEIPLFTHGDNEEKVLNIRAATYNLENGKLVETKLDKSSIFREKRTRNYGVTKFTMPNVKEGCIIEYTYSVSSDYYRQINPWYFQELNAPVLWSELKFNVPQFFLYSFISRGYHPTHIKENKTTSTSYIIRENPQFSLRGYGRTETTTLQAQVTNYRWVMKNVPELKHESFTSSLRNHVSRLEFQFTGTAYPLQKTNLTPTWYALTNELLQSEYFGLALSKENGWSRDEQKQLLEGASSDEEKARRIFTWLRDHITCSDHSAVFTEGPLRSVLKSRKGNVAEINLLLVSMLREAGLNAEPVLLSTADHGYVFEMYPMMSAFNYVICRFETGNKEYFLDASVSGLGFGKLLPKCYNGHARVINEKTAWVTLSADHVLESKTTSVFISNLENGKWGGAVTQTPGYYSSHSIRSKLKESGVTEYFREMEKGFTMNVKIENPKVEFASEAEQPLKLEFQFDITPQNEGLIYFNPMLHERRTDHPFKSQNRFFPVEMPYAVDDIYLLTLEIPKGYEVDELPRSMIAHLDEEGKSFFEYRISQSGEIISLRSRVKISRAYFSAEEYEDLREFFSMLVKKQAEQIVFKRKS